MMEILNYIFCRHLWEKLDEQTTQSRAEHAKQLNMEILTRTSYDTQQVLKRKHIITYHCVKCGKLNTIETAI